MSEPDLRDETLLSYRCAITPDALWLLRRLFEQWLTEQRVSADDIDDLVVVVNELCSSVVVHGRGEEIDVHANLRDGEVRLEVRGSEQHSDVHPAEIALARTLCRTVEVRRTARRATLTCARPVTLVVAGVPQQRGAPA